MKKATLILLFLSSFVCVKAQTEFMHTLGLSIYGGNNTYVPGILYSPRLNIVINNEIAFSLGSHIGLGYFSESNSRSGNGSTLKALVLPLMLECNLGNGATSESESSFGGFVGIGYGLARLESSSSNDVGFMISSNHDEYKGNGVILNGGVRFNTISIRASYLLNKLNEANMFSVGIQRMF